MDKLIIRGSRPLRGSIPISGAKNAALPLMACALLTDRPLRLSNLPRLADLATMGDLLNHHGAMVTLEAGPGNGNGGAVMGRTMTLHAARIVDPSAPYDIVRKMRASILVLGPLLAREGVARVSLPGGCAIGTRPIDLHLMGLEALGATMTLEAGYVSARAPKSGLHGGIVRFPKISVGATENLLMAAALARGGSRLENAAAEPEIVDLGRCLIAMGARIEGLGTRNIEVEGVSRLSDADYHVMPDRIEAGSYAVAAALTGGDLLLEGADPASMAAIIACLEAAGAETIAEAGGLRVRRDGPLRPIEIETAPYPEFPTDMQAQIMSLAALAPGVSTITESIFENRFMHVQELVRLGADIRVEGARAIIRGVPELTGAPVMATDLRASMSLVLAGLVAKGTTELHRLYHLDRGYERIEDKLVGAGADVARVAA